jgi:hypothetical protein
MPFVNRNEHNQIVSTFAAQQYEDQEFLEEAVLYVPPKTYAELRQAEYPPIVDLIDGLVKDDADQIAAYKAACLAVKAKYPKPA